MPVSRRPGVEPRAPARSRLRSPTLRSPTLRPLRHRPLRHRPRSPTPGRPGQPVPRRSSRKPTVLPANRLRSRPSRPPLRSWWIGRRRSSPTSRLPRPHRPPRSPAPTVADRPAHGDHLISSGRPSAEEIAARRSLETASARTGGPSRPAAAPVSAGGADVRPAAPRRSADFADRAADPAAAGPATVAIRATDPAAAGQRPPVRRAPGRPRPAHVGPRWPASRRPGGPAERPVLLAPEVRTRRRRVPARPGGGPGGGPGGPGGAPVVPAVALARAGSVAHRVVAGAGAAVATARSCSRSSRTTRAATRRCPRASSSSNAACRPRSSDRS